MIYEETLRSNAAELAELVHPPDVVILHDPQTAVLVDAVRRTGATVIWRCHVGLDRANERAREAWSFLRPYVHEVNAYVFSRAAFGWEGLVRAKISVIMPSIDVFSPKNAGQSRLQELSILARAGIAPRREESRTDDADPHGCRSGTAALQWRTAGATSSERRHVQQRFRGG